MKIIKTAKYIEKTAQFDDFDDYEPYEGEDYNNWEDEQVFQDREGQEYDNEEDPDEYQSIEPVYDMDGEIEGYELVEHGTYPESSVLAGQASRKVMDGANTIEELQAKYPDAEVSDISSHMSSEFGGPTVPDDLNFGSDYGERSDDYNDDPRWGV
ncbi:hypothetical protein HN803_04385 [candidate division WWE3 bacterium]|jgi:hypothetical protein|nr:hypothetical protein [candidate division WWE3 bacterium]